MGKLKIQIALDRMTIEDCVSVVEKTQTSIDWIEIGTGVIKEYGMSVVREMRARFPEKTIVADMKTCDAGKHESLQAFHSGANISTVMGYASNATILQCLEVASEQNGEMMIDLLGVQSPERVKEIHSLGARLFCLHIGKDMQQDGKLATSDLFRLVEGLEDIRIAVAGGVNVETVPGLVTAGVDIVIAGSFITGSAEPNVNAERLFNEIEKHQ